MKELRVAVCIQEECGKRKPSKKSGRVVYCKCGHEMYWETVLLSDSMYDYFRNKFGWQS